MCYRHLIGSLVYVVVTRPDISYHVYILSQFVSTPTHFTIVTFFVFYDIFVAWSHVVSSVLVIAPYSPRPTLMLHGLVIIWIFTHFLHFLVVLSLHGRERKRMLFPARVQRLLEYFDVYVITPISLLSDSTCATAISTAQDLMKYELTKHKSVDASFVCTVV
jgi:hypothetical protein